MNICGDNGHAEPASALLLRLVNDHPGPRVRLGDLAEGLGDRAYGLLMLMLSLPNSLPLPSPPGLSTLFGAPLILVSAQLALGRPRPWLPRRLLERSLAKEDLQRFLTRALPYMQRVERRVRPRWESFAAGWSERLVGLVCCVMAVILALPIVFGNFPPALSIAVLSLGLVEKDGAAILIGHGLALVAAAIVGLVLYIGVEAVTAAIRQLF